MSGCQPAPRRASVAARPLVGRLLTLTPLGLPAHVLHLPLLRTWLLTRLSHMDYTSFTRLTLGLIIVYSLRDIITRPLLARYGRLRKYLLQLAHRIVNGLATYGTRLAWFGGAASSALPPS